MRYYLIAFFLTAPTVWIYAYESHNIVKQENQRELLQSRRISTENKSIMTPVLYNGSIALPTNASVTTTDTIPTVSPVNRPLLDVTSSFLSSTASETCCLEGFTGYMAWSGCQLYFQCVAGVVVGAIYTAPGGYLYDQKLQSLNWEDQVDCIETNCNDGSTPATTVQIPSEPLSSEPSSDPCCTEGLNGFMAWNGCKEYFQCVQGVVVSEIYTVPEGYLFDQTLQNLNWVDGVNCVEASCKQSSTQSAMVETEAPTSSSLVGVSLNPTSKITLTLTTPLLKMTEEPTRLISSTSIPSISPSVLLTSISTAAAKITSPPTSIPSQSPK